MDKYADQKLAVLAVHAADAPTASIAKLVKDKGLKQQVLLNGQPVARDYGVSGLPLTVFIDREGVVRHVESGFGGAGPLNEATASLCR